MKPVLQLKLYGKIHFGVSRTNVCHTVNSNLIQRLITVVDAIFIKIIGQKLVT